jgi:hypothetical protein
MSNYHVRLGGKIYGPFATDQLQQMAANGRINGSTDVSQDQRNWVPAASILGAGLTQTSHSPHGGSSSDGVHGGRAKSAASYLAGLRNRTHYPFYRTIVLICSILGYVIACLPVLALFFKLFWTGMSSIEVYEPFAAFFAALVIGVFVTVIREIASMYADLVDSTLDHHSRRA